MGARGAEERAIERAGRAGRGGGGRARLRSALAGGAAMLAGRCVSGSGAGARCGPGPPAGGTGAGAVPLAAGGVPAAPSLRSALPQVVSRSWGSGRRGPRARPKPAGSRYTGGPGCVCVCVSRRVPASCREPAPTDLTYKISITSPGCPRSCLRVCLWRSASPQTPLRCSRRP